VERDSNVNKWNSRRTGFSIAASSPNHPFKSLAPILVSRRFSLFQSAASAGLSGGSDLLVFLANGAQRSHAAVRHVWTVLLGESIALVRDS
jgi:hypothetical protein